MVLVFFCEELDAILGVGERGAEGAEFVSVGVIEGADDAGVVGAEGIFGVERG